MGHCPAGFDCAFYGDEGCLGCDLCEAVTKNPYSSGEIKEILGIKPSRKRGFYGEGWLL